MKKNNSYKLYSWGGISFLLVGLALLFFIAPRFSYLSSDFSYQADVISHDNFYDEAAEKYQGELTSKSRFFYQTVASNNHVLDIEHVFDVRQLNDVPIFSVTRNYAIDARTGRHVPEQGDVSREGYLFAPKEKIAKKDTFTYWHVNYNVPAQMEYQESIDVDGLELHRYRAYITADQTDDLTNLPQVPEERGIITEAVLDIWVEPVTGYLVRYQDIATAWYYDQSTGDKIVPWNSFSNTYSDLSYRFHVDQARKQRTLSIIFSIASPTIFIGIGLIFAVLFFLKKHKEKNTLYIKTKAQRQQFHIFLVPIVVFLMLIFVTLWVWSSVKQKIITDNTELFEQETQLIEAAVKSRANLYIAALKSGVGLFDASDNVSRDEWKKFSESLELQKNFPGIQGYGYSLYIPKNTRESHINKIRSEGFPEYTIKPAGERDEYTSIIYLEPFDERNQQAFGFDMFSEKNRRAAMTAARDTGDPQMSARVTLVQEIDEDVQAGFLIYLPQYLKGIALNNTDNRKRALEGYVYAPFRMKDFLNGILGDRELVIDFSVYDGDRENVNNEEYFMYSSKRPGEPAVPEEFSYLTSTRTITIANHNWTLVFSPRPEFGIGASKTLSATLALFSGIVLSFLISLIFYLLSASQLRAQIIALRMTENLRNETAQKEKINEKLEKKISEVELARKNAEIEDQKTKAILASIGDGLVVVDKDGNIVLVNNAFEKMTGLPSGDILGKKMSKLLSIVDEHGVLIPEAERPITRTLGNQKPTNNGNKIIEYIRDDGTKFPVAISVAPILIDNEFIGAVEVFRDITKEYEVDKAKTEFVSLASHQLRTPLTAINWYTEMLLTDTTEKLSPTQRDYVNEINNGSNRMIELVNALLNVSRIELGNFAVDPKIVNPKDILQSVVKDMKVLTKEKKIKLKVDDTKSPDEYIADTNLFRMIFQNLISNSIKYTNTGEVVVSIYPKDAVLRIEVKDSGYGIPEDQKEYIFSKLFRADNVRAQDTTGTGLGLYIIKSIIESVDGKIWFESTEGEGTTFFVELPLDGMKKKEGSKPLEL